MQNANEWIQYLLEVLFQADDRRIAKAIQHLNVQNTEIKKQPFHGFMHHGVRFIDPRYKKIQASLSKHPLPTLSLQLMPQLRLFDEDCKRIELDKSRVRQALVPLLVNCLDLQDIRDSIPDCLAMLSPQLAALPRQRECLTTHIRSNQFAMKAFDKALPIIEQYSVAALIY